MNSTLRWFLENKEKRTIEIVDDCMAKINTNKGSKVVWFPSSEDYSIDCEIVDRAKNLGANIIAYPSWCQSTKEAESYAISHHLEIVKIGVIFKIAR